MAATITQTSLDSTIAALRGGLTCIPLQAAVQMLNQWQDQLAGTELSSQLGNLKTSLMEGNAEGTLARLLSTIGKQATEAADGADEATAAKLKQLGHLLSQMGQSFD